MTNTVVDASDLFRRRAIRLAPSADPWADHIAATLMLHWPDAPDAVTEAWTIYVLNYRDQTGREDVQDVPWGELWRAFMDGWRLDAEDGGDAA